MERVFLVILKWESSRNLGLEVEVVDIDVFVIINR
jgi:hypothetical protein